MEKGYTLQIRMNEDDREKLEAIRKAYRVDTVSQVIRTIIRETADRLDDWEPWREGKVMCEDCGLFKEADGMFLLIEPSDCHGEGGHYRTQFFSDGRYHSTDRPWQVQIGENFHLTDEEMAGAKDA